MKKNDKLIAVLGVVILILAATGIYVWVEDKPFEATADVEDFFKVTGEYRHIPSSITVSDGNPFYPVVATPLAVNYDSQGDQHIIPLYIENCDAVSTAVEKAQKQIGYVSANEQSDLSAKDFSLYIADKYWKSSEAVLLIEDNELGYSLGIAATPIASYLGIPVIVTDEIDSDVNELLTKLDVKKSFVCGEIGGYGESLVFNDVHQIINATREIIWEKFGHDVEYLTLTNPRDAWLPEILDEDLLISDEGTISTSVHLPSQLKTMIFSGKKANYKIPIPDDYKYALVKLDFRNLEDPEQIEKFGDDIVFAGDLTRYIRSSGNPAIRDEKGNILEDRLYWESVLYDMGGEELSFSATGMFNVIDSAEYEIEVTVEKLENPYYPLIKQLSTVAPYLTAYHQGVIFAKPEFAFAPDDDVKLNGDTLPGSIHPMFNPLLIPLINQHVYENIHVPLNKLLSDIRGIDISGTVEYLKEDCYKNPLNIALVGDTVMLPQYYYRSPHSCPYASPKVGNYGTNTPSDFLYGNIDPEIYSLQPYADDHLENDLYSDFPEVENIVGRIIGYDVQDASALIARTVFYDRIIDGLDDWKDNALVMVGAGTEVQKLPILNAIRNAIGKTEPLKFPSGEKRFLVKRIKNNFEKGDFNARSLEKGAAQRVGFTSEALWEYKTDGILNFIFFPMLKIKFIQGFQNAESFTDLSWWFTSLLGDSSELVKGGEYMQDSNLILLDGHAIYFEQGFADVMLHSLGAPGFPVLIRYLEMLSRTTLDRHGGYGVREVSNLDMGPAVMLAEGCGSGKIDGILPTNSLASSYLHAGVNAYISPTTYSAFYGALEPRPNFGGGVGFGIVGYIKALFDWKLKNEFPPVEFNQFVFEETMLQMFDEDVSIGQALRDSKNDFLPEKFDDKMRWRPVLNLPPSLPGDLVDESENSYKSTAKGLDNYPVEKYATIFQVNLLGDPTFNPYEPCNEG